ncbi:MAG: ribosome silencing factor [Bacteroidales bacterium]|nr:ribosome silencing factor [Bacteroidales bacterium]
MKVDKVQTKKLVSTIAEGIFKKKGKRVVSLDLSKIENSICKYFVICHGESTTQTAAIGESVIDVVRNELGERPIHKEGFQHANWVLLDYGDVIVHIFLESYRELYSLEDLWADAKFESISEAIVND